MFHLCDEFSSGGLPPALIERYRVADGPAIKVALFLLCAGQGTEESVADGLSLPLETVARALQFWKSAGLISDDPTKKPAAPKQQTADLAPDRERKPLSPARISEMSMVNPSIAVLLQETQNYLGRTLDSNESRMLLEILEYDELPVDVILMILAWSTPRARSKRSVISYAAKTAAVWREDGIVTARDAERHIRKLELREAREKEVAAALDLPDAGFTRSQSGYIAQWYELFGYNLEFVKEAYLRTGKNSVNYLHSVLKSWHQSGYKTLRDTAAQPANAPTVPAKQKKNAENSLLKRAVDKRTKERVTHGV